MPLLAFASGRWILAWHVLLMAVAALGAPAQAQEVLRWGADKEGGAPYVFSPDDEPDRLIGFEIELADALAAKLNSRSEFVQGQWDQLLSVLRREDVDIVLNGYEYTPDRASQYLASYPYYVYELGLAVLRDDAETRSWDDLGQPYKDGRRKRIGVLTQSAADLYVTARYEASCEIFRFDGVTECLRGIETGQLDASVQDGPILAHYVFQAAKFPSLAVVDKPVAPGYYVVYVRPEDKARVEAVNRAIRELYDEGKLRQIYDRYGLWNAAQNSLPEVWKTWDSSLHERRTTAWRSLVAYFPKFAIAASVTVLLSIISMPLAILIGLLVSIVRMWSSPVLGGSGRTTWLGRLARAPFTIYVELVRGSPLAFQLFVVFFVLPEIGIRIPPFWSGVIALAINYSAYEAEIFRLGLQAIPKGQIEAALALGMPRMLAVRRIILPQAVRLVIPATANDFIALFKDTAVCSVIAVEELSKQYSMAAKSTTLFLEMAVMASVLYLSMSYPLSLLATFLEKKLKREQNA